MRPTKRGVDLNIGSNLLIYTIQKYKVILKKEKTRKVTGKAVEYELLIYI